MLSKIKNTILYRLKSVQHFLATKMDHLAEHPILQLTIFSIALVFIIEMLSHHSIMKGLGFIIHNPLMFLVNTLIVLLTYTFTMMFSRKKFFLILITILWLALGITNFVLLSFRTTPLTAMDFYMVDAALEIIHIYLNYFEIGLILISAAVVIFALILLWTKIKKTKAQFKMPAIMIGMIAAMIVLVSGLSLKVNALSKNYGNIGDAYSDYGFVYCFSNSIFDRGISKPDEYSEENVDQVLEKIVDGPKKVDNSGQVDVVNTDDTNTIETSNIDDDKNTVTKPNVIMIQLESFFDVNHLKNFTFSENPVPNFSKLKENYSHGFLTVPSIGAGTANTEFEILTGMNLDYFGAGEYPYKTILQTTTSESICYNLDELGYKSHAIHNNTGTFYDRKFVFQKLGFDSFSSIEYMDNVEYNPLGWAKDNVLTTEILKALKAKDTRDFIYTISVQPHGKYPSSVVDENQKIKVIVDPNKKLNTQPGIVDGTANDDMWDVNTVVDNSINQNSGIESSSSTKGDTEEDTTENVVTNTNSEEPQKDETNNESNENSQEVINLDGSYENQFDYYVNQLSETDKFVGELVKELSTYEEPTIVVFYGDHLPALSFENEDLENNNVFQTEYVMYSNFEMENKYIDLDAYQLNAYVMNRLGYDNGILTKFHQKYKGEPDYQEELKLLQYDMLFGARNVYGGVNPYIEKPLHMGVYDITIKNVRDKGEVIFVEGENFTPWSTVYMDDKPKQTYFIDNNTLIIPYEEYKEKNIYVAQVNNEKIVLSQSETWIAK
jgi:phosphoglycerol transferase MdoB-like AlkP superfamily enzyme